MMRHMRKFLSSLGLAGLAATLAIAGGTVVADAAQSRIGLKLGVQPWTPLTADDSVQFLLDDPALISNALDKGWADYAAELETTLKAKLGTPNMVSDGVTFYDIDIRLNQPLLSVDSLSGSGIAGDPLTFKLHVDLNNEGVTMSATQPTVAGSYADPRCDASFDARLTLSLSISNDVGAAFSSPQTSPGSEPLVEITRFDFEGDNVVCDLGVGLADLLGIKDTLTRMVAERNGIVNKPLADASRNLLAGALAELNHTVAGYQRPEINLAILRGWLVDQGDGKMVVLNLAPRAPLPDPMAGQGRLVGTLTAGQPSGVVSASSGPIYCDRLPVRVQRVTGPRPMTSPAGTLGAQPVESLAVKTDCASHVANPGQQVRYEISGLSGLFPQIVAFSSTQAKCQAAEAAVQHGIDIKTAWPQGMLLAADLKADHDLTAIDNTVPCGGQQVAFPDVKDRFLKYLVQQQLDHPGPDNLRTIREYLLAQGLTEDILAALATPAALPQTSAMTVRSSTAEPTPPQAPGCASSDYNSDPRLGRATAAANVRLGDDTGCPVIAQLTVGQQLRVLSCTLASGKSSGWCRIDLDGAGKVGYVAKRLIAFGKPAPAKPTKVIVSAHPTDDMTDATDAGTTDETQTPPALPEDQSPPEAGGLVLDNPPPDASEPPASPSQVLRSTGAGRLKLNLTCDNPDLSQDMRDSLGCGPLVDLH